MTLLSATLATLVVAAAATPAHADLPNKNSDRAGWIKASMTGKQAAFCGPVAAPKLSGGSDPDFVAKQVKQQWDDTSLGAIKLDAALSLSNALCKFPGNPDLQKTLMPLWQAFAKQYGLGAADLADFAAVQDPSRTKIELETRAPKDVRFADVDAHTQALVARDLLETSYGMDFMSYAQIMDATPSPTEHLKVGFVEKCLERDSIARWAICKADAMSLDRKRFDQELAAAKIDPRHRLEAKLKFVQLQQAVKDRAAKLDADAKKDDGVAKVIDTIPAAATAKWAEESGPYKDMLAWTAKIVDDARANNKKLMNGCDDELMRHLATYLKAKAPRTPDDLKNAFRDNIGSQLASAAALCFVRDEAARKTWATLSSGFAQHWGVRTMIWHALASEKISFDTNRGTDPLGLPKPVLLYANASASFSNGTIATMKDAGDAFELTFKKETWKEPVCKQWKETNKIDGIDLDSGKLIYRTVCVKSGMETRSSTATPVKVPKRYATGLKVGVSASFQRASDGTAYPTAVYANAKRTKLVGALGVMY